MFMTLEISVNVLMHPSMEAEELHWDGERLRYFEVDFGRTPSVRELTRSLVIQVHRP